MIHCLPTTIDDTTLFSYATAGAQGQRLAALIVGTRKETR
jgi:flagellar motor switch protein FliM